MHRLLSISFVAALVFPGSTAYGIEIDDFVSAENDRFANNSSFVMDGYDLSGVGLSSDGRWATLVADDVVVSSNHFHPSTSGSETVTFYQTNDPGGASATRTVVSGQRIDSSDIWMGVLDSPLPSEYAVYTFATEDINDATEFTTSVYNGKNSFLFGKSGTFSGDQDMAVGRNVLDGWLNDTSAAGTTDDAMTAKNDLEPDDVAYEALLQPGDSGGPMFVDLNNDGSLTLVGSNWLVADVSEPGDQNGFAYYGNHDQHMQDFIPEPASIALLGIGALTLVRRRRPRSPQC